MSFDLDIVCTRIPDVACVVAALVDSRCGCCLDEEDGFDPVNWSGGVVPLRIYPSDVPSDQDDHLVDGPELYVFSDQDTLSWATTGLRSLSSIPIEWGEQPRAVVVFGLCAHGAASIVSAWALAGALAAAGHGIVIDPQADGDEFLWAEDAWCESRKAKVDCSFCPGEDAEERRLVVSMRRACFSEKRIEQAVAELRDQRRMQRLRASYPAALDDLASLRSRLAVAPLPPEELKIALHAAWSTGNRRAGRVLVDGLPIAILREIVQDMDRMMGFSAESYCRFMDESGARLRVARADLLNVLAVRAQSRADCA